MIVTILRTTTRISIIIGLNTVILIAVTLSLKCDGYTYRQNQTRRNRNGARASGTAKPAEHSHKDRKPYQVRRFTFLLI